MRVLIVKTSSMGDVIHTLPALTDALQNIPTIRFDWVVEEGFSQIPSWHQAVDRVIPVAVRRWRKNWFREDIRAERKHFYQQLTCVHYDAVIDAQGLIKSSALITRKSRGIKHGLDWQSAREPVASWWYDRSYRLAKQQHAVEKIRALFARSLGYQKPTTPGDYAIAQHFLNTLPEDANHYLIFLHATTRDDKHWPESAWEALIDLVTARGLKIKLPWGSEVEHQRAIRLATGRPQVEVLPKLTLSEVAKQLAGARAVVSVDTGLSHLTAALDRPNITLYGPTDPALIGGYGKNQHVIKGQPEGKMSEIEPNTVLDKLITICGI
ncbi:lipopolysaccharide heptosyltransferase RfaC [Rosenbergiella australiborealis]|uniref:Lipopolysaccharide heptosyltransferase 1 n=1 Tax=Rosenbergiella australiborealis TaxID=1544696 RepID=A0ABS5T7B6_9GAMM|nr:lipopolysaccharide heptosyltransferase RfaC [Rosenbergiella australiborealis]MBT0727410.1 lipopolysaccharide heptosyltransferase RfaC [Rosenbergiella australiborealis]